MVLLWMFFNFEVEVLEGFETWFLQSFYTSECFWIFFDVACTLNVLVFRNALGRLLFTRVWGVSERHVAKFDWWHVSQSDWRRFKIFFPRYVASFKWPKCFDFQDDTCQLPIGLPMSLLTCAGLLIVITYTCRCVIKFVIDCTLWTW